MTKTENSEKTEMAQSKQAKSYVSCTSAIPAMDYSQRCQQAAWQAFKLDFKILLTAADLVSESDSRKVAVLLHNIGPEGRKVFTSFGVDMEKITLTALIQLYDAHYTQKKNTTMERHNFFTHTQGEQTIMQYSTSLKNLSFSCGFDKLREELVRSVFICGLNPQHNDIKERLLTEGDTTLEKTIEMANIMEASKKSVEKMETEPIFAEKVSTSSQKNTEEVKVAKFRQNFKPSWQPKSQTKYSRVHRSLGCDKCGMVHQFVCPAKDKKCNFCEEIGHFSRRCPLKIRKHRHCSVNQKVLTERMVTCLLDTPKLT